MTEAQLSATASRVLFAEADALDRWQWDQWLELFTDDCEYWCPSWLSETELGSDPMRTLSHFYLIGRVALRDRIDRIRSGLSPIAIPLPRTLHAVNNVQLVEYSDARLRVSSHWQCHTYSHRVSTLVYGFYEHELVRQHDVWRIAKKKITLLNDHLDAPIDVNNV